MGRSQRIFSAGLWFLARSPLVLALLLLGRPAYADDTIHLDAGSWTPQLTSRLMQERSDLEIVDERASARHRVVISPAEDEAELKLVVTRAPDDIPLLTRTISADEEPQAIVRLATLLILRAIDIPDWMSGSAEFYTSSGIQLSLSGVWWQRPFRPQPGLSLGVFTIQKDFLLTLRTDLRGFICCQQTSEGLRSGGFELAGLVQAAWAAYSAGWSLRLVGGVGINLVRLDFEEDPEQSENRQREKSSIEVVGRLGLSVESSSAAGLVWYGTVGVQGRVFPTSVTIPEDAGMPTLRTGVIGPWIEIGTRVYFY